MKLYYHKTDGGAEYLTDTFINWKHNGKSGKEGTFKGAKYIVRIDGDIEKDAELNVNEENKIIYLVRYKAEDTIEGYVNNKEDFENWLKEHNKKRKEEGEIKENKNEFELIEIGELW